MLTKQQVDLLDLLKQVKCLTHSQVMFYLECKHNAKIHQKEAIIRQLRTLGYIYTDDKYVCLPKRKPDSKIIKSFDVMTDITKGIADLFFVADDPYSFIFTLMSEKGKLKDFGVVFVKPFLEELICKKLSQDKRKITVLFVVDNLEQINKIHVEKNHFFVLENEDGTNSYHKSIGRNNLSGG